MIKADTTRNNAVIVTGNAIVHGMQNMDSGWFLGSFIPSSEGLRKCNAVEIKWGDHLAGETKAGFGTNHTASTIAILITGHFILTFPSGNDVSLEKKGDYVIYGPGVPHGWTAIEDSLIITVRWPSLSDDQYVEK